MVTALREHPDLSQVNICTAVTPKGLDMIANIVNGEQSDGIAFTKGTRIELSNGEGINIPIELEKTYIMNKDLSFDVEFAEVSDDEPHWRAFAVTKVEVPDLVYDESFRKDVNDTVDYIKKFDDTQKAQEASKRKKNSNYDSRS